MLTFVFGLLDTSVDVWGHVGGLIGGLVLGNVLGLPKQQTSYSIHQRILSTLVFVFLFVICILLGLKNMVYLYNMKEVLKDGELI